MYNIQKIIKYDKFKTEIDNIFNLVSQTLKLVVNKKNNFVYINTIKKQ